MTEEKTIVTITSRDVHNLLRAHERGAGSDMGEETPFHTGLEDEWHISREMGEEDYVKVDFPKRLNGSSEAVLRVGYSLDDYATASEHLVAMRRLVGRCNFLEKTPTSPAKWSQPNYRSEEEDEVTYEEIPLRTLGDVKGLVRFILSKKFRTVGGQGR